MVTLDLGLLGWKSQYGVVAGPVFLRLGVKTVKSRPVLGFPAISLPRSGGCRLYLLLAIFSSCKLSVYAGESLLGDGASA